MVEQKEAVDGVVGPSRHRKTRVGLVRSDKMDKSIVVDVSRRVKHRAYGKYMTKHHRYLAHDAEGTAKVGDQVMIEECRPLSRHKRWRLKSVVRAAT